MSSLARKIQQCQEHQHQEQVEERKVKQDVFQNRKSQLEKNSST